MFLIENFVLAKASTEYVASVHNSEVAFQLRFPANDCYFISSRLLIYAVHINSEIEHIYTIRNLANEITRCGHPRCRRQAKRNLPT